MKYIILTILSSIILLLTVYSCINNILKSVPEENLQYNINIKEFENIDLKGIDIKRIQRSNNLVYYQIYHCSDSFGYDILREKNDSIFYGEENLHNLDECEFDRFPKWVIQCYHTALFMKKNKIVSIFYFFNQTFNFIVFNSENCGMFTYINKSYLTIPINEDNLHSCYYRNLPQFSEYNTVSEFLDGLKVIPIYIQD